MLHSSYDNTLKVKNEAQKVVLPEISGNEIQLYKLGLKVRGNGFNFGEIIDVYKDNGCIRWFYPDKEDVQLYYELMKRFEDK